MKAVRGFDLKKITDRKEKEGICIQPESGMSALSPFSLSLILDCLHKVVLAWELILASKKSAHLLNSHLF